MAVLRNLIFLALLGCVACFALFALTGKPRYRQIGVRVLSWVVASGLLFFAVLVLERVL